MSNVKKNYIFSLIYQILNIIVPLITTPYLSRVLGAEQVGIYSYTNSIVQYFVLISMLGIVDYGSRTIASIRECEVRSENFKEIYLIQLIASILAIFIYYFFIFFIYKQYLAIAVIQGIALLSSLLDINWFFWGIENFKLTVTRNMIIKIISLFAIFVLVKDNSDLGKYVLIITLSTLIGNIILWCYLKNEVTDVKICKKDIVKHFFPCLTLMIPLISRSIFVYMDKTMLGILGGMIETGYYEYSEKIILAATSVLTPLGTVMLPRISCLLSEGMEKEANRYTELSLEFVVAVGGALTLGIIAVSDNLVMCFLGQNFMDCSCIVKVMAVTVILVGWTNVIRTQYILPYKKDRIYILAVVGGAIVDFMINLLLIPKYGAVGAAIGWVAAEIVITVTQTCCAGRKLPIFQCIKKCRGYVGNALIMYLIIKILNSRMPCSLGTLICKVTLGIIIYSFLGIIYIKRNRTEIWDIVNGKIEKYVNKKR